MTFTRHLLPMSNYSLKRMAEPLLGSRTRQKVDNKAVYQSLIDWTRGKAETNGFKLLVEKGLSEYTGEYLVVRCAGRFPEDVVALARRRLTADGISMPDR